MSNQNEPKDEASIIARYRGRAAQFYWNNQDDEDRAAIAKMEPDSAFKTGFMLADQLTNTRADAWKAIAGRLAELVAECQEGKQEDWLNTEWDKSAWAVMEAFDDLMKKEG
jgi:hypothetical protein